MVPKDTKGMANSVDPHQTAPLGSGSALFVQIYLSQYLKFFGNAGFIITKKKVTIRVPDTEITLHFGSLFQAEVYGYNSMFSVIFSKGDNFCDFLFFFLLIWTMKP